jgi:hypothetical protein
MKITGLKIFCVCAIVLAALFIVFTLQTAYAAGIAVMTIIV